MSEVHPGFAGSAGRSVALCALALSWLAGMAWASDGSASPLREGEAPAGAVPGTGDAALAFDIPSLPLADALKRYAAVTRQPALFRSEILAGLTSSAVRGLYAPDTALELLLEGTGLVAEKVRTGSAVTLALRPAQARAEAPRAASLGSLAGYPSLLQARVWEALCGNVRTRPGTYRSLLRFEVDEGGQLRRPRLLGLTGDAARDAEMLEVLRGVRLAHAPPPDLPQPLTLLILPTDARGGTRCREAAGRSPS
ncbi:hypothetical protein [Variovorax boronicumulans]|uniref:hypothetical protein n=1 Tax=Variovorax boronicumulans TaxID=436515 RepID=UPI00089410B2|nr:hypothetical protein [Variovorax boronicumulans]OEZ27301.1 hypothetical protein AO062_28805 [Variovorax boronicumulans]